jgi:hypothetical protein
MVEENAAPTGLGEIVSQMWSFLILVFLPAAELAARSKQLRAAATREVLFCFTLFFFP